MPKKTPLTEANNNSISRVEKEVIILLSDMVGYSIRANNMSPSEIQSFMLEYHSKLKKIVSEVCGDEHKIEPSAGDGAVAIFNIQSSNERISICNMALNTALAMIHAMEDGNIPKTRIGLFNGLILEAVMDGKTMRFGSSFTVASRLEELCSYFGTSLLMGREVARLQTEHRDYLISIGKITPKNFTHPIHIFSVYRPGVHNCPVDIDYNGLKKFIRMKNEAVELFCGNHLENIRPNFPLAKEKLQYAQDSFFQLTGVSDLATDRLLQYIKKNPCPEDDFENVGMKIWPSETVTSEVLLPSLSGALLKSVNHELFEALIEKTDWEEKFNLIWVNRGEHVFELGDVPDGIYFVAKGTAKVYDRLKRNIETLNPGDIFGEVAYFSPNVQRTATVTATTDLVLRRVSGKDLNELPVIRSILNKIAKKRRRL